MISASVKVYKIISPAIHNKIARYRVTCFFLRIITKNINVIIISIIDAGARVIAICLSWLYNTDRLKFSVDFPDAVFGMNVPKVNFA